MPEDRALRLEVERIYIDRRDDPPFRDIVSTVVVADDGQLAELVEIDGRYRLQSRREVPLARYLSDIPDLHQRPDPLDAAIDMAIRSLTSVGRSEDDAVNQLIGQHPDLAAEIRDAAALNNAIWSTQRLRHDFGHTPEHRALPCDFGPPIEGHAARYQLIELLGAGAFGEVYQAIDRQLSEEDKPAMVAIKILADVGDDDWARERLSEEATKARRIDHDHVVRVIDRGRTDDGEDFIVYEYIAGGDLAKWVREQPQRPSITKSAALMREIAEGVHAAHMAGLVHCDLKPNNIMLTEAGETKVADFGVAARADEATDAEDGSRPRGNLAFISPEQYRQEPGALTPPSDIYALGGVLFWLLTGVLPNGDSPEAIARVHDAEDGRPAPPSARLINPKVDPVLDRICQRAMAIRPADRHASASALADDLGRWLNREPIPWQRPSLAQRFGLWARRKPALAAVSMVLLVGAGVLIGVVDRYRQEAVARQAEQEYREQFRAVVGELRASLGAIGQDRLVEDLLPRLWGVEWLFGPTVLGVSTDPAVLWEQRIAAVRLLLADAARDDARSVDALMWDTVLCFWLIQNGDPVEASERLASLRAAWDDHLDPADELREVHAALAAAAAVYSELQSTPPDPEVIRDAVGTLEDANRRFADRPARIRLRILILDALADAYGPAALDERALAAERLVAAHELAGDENRVRPGQRVEDGAE